MVAFFLALCGVGLFVFYSEQSDLPIQTFHRQLTTEADRLMPRFIVEVLPSGFSGLLLAALLAAAMSSLSSGINSISSVISSDFVERFGWGGKRTESLWLEKVVAFVTGLVGVAVAIGIMTAARHTDWNLLELTSRVNHIFVGPIAALFFGEYCFASEEALGAVWLHDQRLHECLHLFWQGMVRTRPKHLVCMGGRRVFRLRRCRHRSGKLLRSPAGGRGSGRTTDDVTVCPLFLAPHPATAIKLPSVIDQKP